MAAPPSYSENPAQLEPQSRQTTSTIPEYSTPHTFFIGPRQTPPLVTVDQLKAHLSLLKLFLHLRAKAEVLELPQIPSQPTQSLKERRWSFFVSYAVERFEAWCCSPGLAFVDELSLFLPPPDVLMVWHAYRLNPGWYLEDSARLPSLLRLETVAGSLFPCLLSSDAQRGSGLQRFQRSLMDEVEYDRLGEPSSEDHVNQWTHLTDMLYDAFEGILEWNRHNVTCAFCQVQTSTKLIADDGSGYLQSSFRVRCSECEKELDREVLGVAKFARTFVLSDNTNASLLAGTLHTPASPTDVTKAASIKQVVNQSRFLARPPGSTPAQWQIHIGDSCKWNLSTLLEKLGHRMEFKGGKMLEKMKKAYSVDRPFSLDLVGAVLRQASFIEKMARLGWTESGCFTSATNEIVLLHAVARYHSFLNLMSSRPTHFLVPTLDIDLAWHTHQLFSARYERDTRRYVGRFVDHDDKVEDAALANGFNVTSKEWEKRFGVPYSTCGCYIPQKNRITQVWGRKKPNPDTHLLPFTQHEHAAATHPSDHNGAVPNSGSKQPTTVMGYDPFWGHPLSYTSLMEEPSSCVAASSLVHAGCGTITMGSGFQHRSMDNIQDPLQITHLLKLQSRPDYGS